MNNGGTLPETCEPRPFPVPAARLRALAAFLSLGICPLCAQPTTPEALLKMKVPPVENRISYGSDPFQFGELRLPKRPAPHPVAIVIHGGCWSAVLPGIPRAATSIDLIRPLAAALAQAGVATWNIEYRRLGNQGGGWPGTFQDLARAADSLRELAPKYGLDLDRLVAMGHSSGGQLALWLAGRHKLPPASELYSRDPIRLAGVIDIDGPPDLAADGAVVQQVCGGPVIPLLMGGTPDVRPERYKQASAAALLPLGVRQELVAGGAFGDQWIGLNRSYEAAARRAGDHVHLEVRDSAGHFDWLDPQSAAWSVLLKDVRSLVSLK